MLHRWRAGPAARLTSSADPFRPSAVFQVLVLRLRRDVQIQPKHLTLNCYGNVIVRWNQRGPDCSLSQASLPDVWQRDASVARKIFSNAGESGRGHHWAPWGSTRDQLEQDVNSAAAVAEYRQHLDSIALPGLLARSVERAAVDAIHAEREEAYDRSEAHGRRWDVRHDDLPPKSKISAAQDIALYVRELKGLGLPPANAKHGFVGASLLLSTRQRLTPPLDLISPQQDHLGDHQQQTRRFQPRRVEERVARARRDARQCRQSLLRALHLSHKVLI